MVVAEIGALDAPVALAIFMTLGAVVFVPLSTRGAMRLWRNETRIYDGTPAWWLWGDTLWRAYVRTLSALGLTFAIDLVLIVGLLWGPDSTATILVLGIPLLATMAIAAVLAVGIALFNRPRAAVPPHLRHEGGAVDEWRARRRLDRTVESR